MIGLFIPDPDPDFFYPSRIPDPGVKKAGTGSRIRIRNTGIYISLTLFADFVSEPKGVDCAFLIEKVIWLPGIHLHTLTFSVSVVFSYNHFV
jgi:hypothetical protein